MRRFRLRPFRPALRAARLVPWVGRAVLRRLRQAHRLREIGRYGEAAAGFAALEQSAWKAAPGKAALLAVEAGLSFLRSGEAERGRSHLELGLDWLQRNADPARTVSIRSRAARELRSVGLDDEAARLEAGPPATTPPSPQSPRPLPSKCPHCGGGILPAEVLWADEHSVVCGYCGSRVPAEG